MVAQQTTTTTTTILTNCPNPTTKTTSRRLIFTYGTLKRGFPNHPLLQDMFPTNDAHFLGPCTTSHPLPLVCGPHRVPFLLNFPGSGSRVSGELYAVSDMALAKMDDLEGTARGHYERLPANVILNDGEVLVEAEAYYAHRDYAAEMWRRNGEVGFACYGVNEAKGYVRRIDRPRDLSFLEQIRRFCSSSSNCF